MTKRMWNLAELRKYITTEHPEKGWLVSTVESVGNSLYIYQYHKELARDAFAAFQAEQDPHGIKLFAAAMMAGTDEELEAFEDAMLASEANLIAAINITRNTFDIFSQLVNALSLPEPIEIGKCDIHKVREKLPDGPLKSEITQTTNSHWFKYLAGFSNTTKHRQLISHKPTQRYDSNETPLGGGAEVAAFEYRDEIFPKYWVQDVLEGTVEMHNRIVTLGIILNDSCLHQNHKNAGHRK